MTFGRALLVSARLVPAARAEDLRPSFVFFLADDHAERALNIDLARTFLELAGVLAPERLQGRSLVPWGGPLWTGAARSTRHVVVAADARAPWDAVPRVFAACGREVPDDPTRPAPGTVVAGDPRDNPAWLP